MAQTSNRDLFFQTSASLDAVTRKNAKSKNKDGNPIRLSSKILAVKRDPKSPDNVYVAESATDVRKVNLKTGETLKVYRGPSAPVTCISFSASGDVLFAGCWDKKVWSWNIETANVTRTYDGHQDFVKSVLCLRSNNRELLVSGDAKGELLVWDISDGKRLHSYSGHTRAINDLSIDPLSPDEEDNNDSQPVIYSAGSDRTIRSLKITPILIDQELSNAIVQHETGLSKILFDADGDLWTASADKTAKCLSREKAWAPELTLKHPDFVRDVIVHEQGGWVVTACRDEEVRVWDRATGKLYHTYSGHYEEVTGLVLIDNEAVSVSIDGTIRRWPLDGASLQKAKAEAENPKPKEEKSSDEVLLTEEEERELAELTQD